MRYASLGLLALAAVFGCSEPPSRPVDSAPDLATHANPPDYVLTPVGRLPQACVHLIPDGAVVEMNNTMRTRDGVVHQIKRCTRPADAGVQTGGASTYWVESDSTKASGSSVFKKIAATWTVPENPVGAYTNQVYYTFPGLENGYYIIQPVLQYGYNGRFGGSYWILASWKCHDSYDCDASPSQITTTAGHSINGSVVASNCSTTCTWTITAQDVTSGQQVSFAVVDYNNYQWAGGAVEVATTFSVCNHYPVNGVFYSNVQLYNGSMTQVYPTWTTGTTSGVSPSCTFGASSPSPTVWRLTHNPAPAPALTTLVTTPSPAKQYLPNTVTLTGSGFNPATVQGVITGAPGSSCPTACYIVNGDFSTKTSTQLVDTHLALSITGTYTLRVRNGDGGLLSAGRDFTIVP